MPRGALEDVSSSPSDSDADPFSAPSQKEFIIPSPVTLSGEDVSPSQYRKNGEKGNHCPIFG